MKNNSFFKDVITLGTVPVISQILGLILTPIVTRIYNPDDFGLYNLFGSIVILISVFATMGYHSAIILPEKNVKSKDILSVCFLILTTNVTFVFLIIFFFKEQLLFLFNAPNLNSFIIYIPLVVFNHGLYQILRFWNTRLKYFKTLSISRVGEIISRKSLQISIGTIGLASTGGLIFSDLIANSIKNIILLRTLDIKYLISNRKKLFNFWKIVKRYKKFPQYSLPAEFLSRIPSALFSILILKYFGQSILGFYGLAILVLSLPSALISVSVSEAFIPRAAMAKHSNQHVKLLEKIYLRLTSIMLLPFLSLALFSESLFPFIFGSEWIEAGMICKILVIRSFFEIIFSPSLSLVDILEKQELHFFRQIINSVLPVISIFIGVYFENIYATLWCQTILESMSIILFGGYMLYFIKFPIRISFLKFLKYLFFACALSFALQIIVNYFSLFGYLLLILILCVHAIYYSILIFLDKEIAGTIKSIFKS